MAGLNGSIKSSRLGTSLSTKKVSVSVGRTGAVLVTDHANLTNLDYESSGHTGFAGILMDTTENWDSQTTYVPPEGMIIVYTDYSSYTDSDSGETVYVPGFKIGDGNAYLVDMAFLGQDVSALLQEHIADGTIHITDEERQTWNNKLNYVEPTDDLLEFTRD